MIRYRGGFKETYEQVGDFEYNQINPYAQTASSIKQEYPDAKIKRTLTEFEWHYLPLANGKFKWMLIPYFTMFYEVSDAGN